MWKCTKCATEVDDHLAVCFSCGTTKEGVADPSFQRADDPKFDQKRWETGQATPAPNATGSTTTPSPGSPQHEFSAEDNQVFRALGNNLYWVGIFAICLGALSLIGGVASLNPGAIIAGFIYLAIGTWTTKASGSFDKVAQTQGSDIYHLMTALKNLNQIYALLATIILVGIILVTVALLASLIVALIFAFQESGGMA